VSRWVATALVLWHELSADLHAFLQRYHLENRRDPKTQAYQIIKPSGETGGIRFEVRREVHVVIVRAFAIGLDKLTVRDSSVFSRTPPA
jgi:hypothetical protein